jgi:hypothetical protein
VATGFNSALMGQLLFGLDLIDLDEVLDSFLLAHILIEHNFYPYKNRFRLGEQSYKRN